MNTLAAAWSPTSDAAGSSTGSWLWSGNDEGTTWLHAFDVWRPLRILLADADTVSRAIIRRSLRRLDYDALAVADPADLVQATHSAPFDLILIDNALLSGSGRLVIRRVRSQHTDAQPPTIVLVASETAYLGVRPHEFWGVDDTLYKPLRLPTVARLLNQCAAQAPPCPVEPPLDLSHITVLSGDRPSALREMVRSFLMEGQPLIDALTAVGAAADASLLQRAADRLQIGAACVGANALAATAARLAAQPANRALLPPVTAEWQRLLHHLRLGRL